MLDAIRYAASIADWDRWVGDRVSLVILEAPYASFIQPFVAHVASVERQHSRVFTLVRYYLLA